MHATGSASSRACGDSQTRQRSRLCLQASMRAALPAHTGASCSARECQHRESPCARAGHILALCVENGEMSWKADVSGARHASGSAAYGKALDLQRRLAYADRHALAFLAAGADAVVELQIVPHHRDPRQHIGPVADERRALQRRRDTSVLDEVSL